MIYQVSEVEQFRDEYKQRSRRAIGLKCGTLIAFLLVITVSFSAEVYAQGIGGAISFNRVNKGLLNEVRASAQARAFADGQSQGFGFGGGDGVGPSIARARASASGVSLIQTQIISLGPPSPPVAPLENELNAFSIAESEIHPALFTSTLNPALALRLRSNDEQNFVQAGGKSSFSTSSASVTSDFITSPGSGNFTPDNQFATMKVLIYFLHRSQRTDSFGTGRAFLGSTNSPGSDSTLLTFQRMDSNDLYAITGSVSNTLEGLPSNGVPFLEVSQGGVDHLIQTSHRVHMNGEILAAAISGTSRSEIPEIFGGFNNPPLPINDGYDQTIGKTNVALYFEGNDKSPADGFAPAGIRVYFDVTRRPFDGFIASGPVFVAFNGKSTITAGNGLDEFEFDVMDPANPDVPVTELGPDFDFTVTDSRSGQEFSFDRGSPEVTFNEDAGRVEVDLSSLDLPPGFYTIDIGEGFSQQYYVPLLGDVNRDGIASFSDISPFVELLTSSTFQYEGDANEDGAVNFLDISSFIVLLVTN